MILLQRNLQSNSNMLQPTSLGHILTIQEIIWYNLPLSRALKYYGHGKKVAKSQSVI